MLTAAQLTAKLARTAAARTARAERRVAIAAATGGDPFSTKVRRAAARRVRAA